MPKACSTSAWKKKSQAVLMSSAATALLDWTQTHIHSWWRASAAFHPHAVSGHWPPCGCRGNTLPDTTPTSWCGNWAAKTYCPLIHKDVLHEQMTLTRCCCFKKQNKTKCSQRQYFGEGKRTYFCKDNIFWRKQDLFLQSANDSHHLPNIIETTCSWSQQWRNLEQLQLYVWSTTK